MNLHSFKPAPQPEPAEQPDPATTPTEPAEQPRRRRMIQPVFRFRHGRAGRPMHRLFTALAFCATAALATAQTGSTTTTGGTTPTPQIDKPANGWTLFNNDVARQYALTGDQMTRLRAMDDSYATDYDALGKDPIKASGYRTLSDRRNAEVRTVLKPEQYTRWEKQYNTGNLKPMDTPSTPRNPTTPMPKNP